MHSLSNMAAVRYFPSIHDNSTENVKIWPVFDGRPKQLNSRNVGSTSHFYNRPWRAGQSSSASRRVEAAWSTLGCPAASEYRPLNVFGATAEDPSPASWVGRGRGNVRALHQAERDRAVQHDGRNSRRHPGVKVLQQSVMEGSEPQRALGEQLLADHEAKRSIAGSKCQR
ncbi:hypothetical protein L3Q82_006079 [Scortum barcoo]|uniref:Uncharacterized protein n=1 Tax=Scortum barcoo TaxID=214431 RepID=A0ACB8X3B5_9TELE|nr:hypothetical protein L3Q82_006079 [Scortum barcoo]